MMVLYLEILIVQARMTIRNLLIVPSAEVCDNVDNNCNGQVDESQPIACNLASDCGSNGYVGSTYCGGEDNVYGDYRIFTCSSPGTCSSSCSLEISSWMWQGCGATGCTNGMCNTNNQTNST